MPSLSLLIYGLYRDKASPPPPPPRETELVFEILKLDVSLYGLQVSFQITVNAAQAKLGALELKNFKATGYLGKVNSKQVRYTRLHAS